MPAEESTEDRPASGARDWGRRRERAADIDLLNVLASLLVVYLHVRLRYWEPAPTPAWWLENLLSGVGVVAVPVFLMNTGRTLVGFAERESISRFIRKRLSKVLVPYLLWAQLYLIFHWAMGWVPGISWGRWCGVITSGSSEAHTLWYLEALLAIYLVLPVLSMAVVGARKAGLGDTVFAGWVAALAFAASTLLPLARYVAPGLTPGFQLPFGGYLVYVAVGYWVSVTSLGRSARASIYLAGFAGYLSFTVLGGSLMLAGDDGAQLWTGYLSIGVVAFATAVYTAVLHLPWRRWPVRVRSVLAQLAGLSFGTYLIHLMLIEALSTVLPLGRVAWEIPYTIMIWGSSMLLTWVLQRVPLLHRWLVP